MTSRSTRYVAAFVAASLAYLFVALAFAGRFDVVEWAAFGAFFLVAFYAFERFFDWVDAFG